MNHRRLALRREETRQIVLTCLAGGILVLQCFTDLALLLAPQRDVLTLPHV